MDGGQVRLKVCRGGVSQLLAVLLYVAGMDWMTGGEVGKKGKGK